MTGLRVLALRFAAMLGFGRRDDELSDEMQLHLELLTEDHRRRGLSEEDARLAARRAFGGMLSVREAYRAQQRLPSVDALTHDVRFAVRRLLRDRTSTLAAIGLLSLGVTSTVIMGDMLDRLLLRPPAGVDAPDRVARVYDQAEDGRPSAMVTNYATMERLSSGLREDVEFMAVYMTERLGLGRGPDARRLAAVTHSEAYFDVLGLTPEIGVLPTARHPGLHESVVISHGLWLRQFGGSRDVLGHTLRLGRRLYTIVAVAPRGFRGLDTDPVDVWLPLDSRVADGALLSQDWRTSTGYYMFSVIARLRPGIERARAEVHASAVYNAGPVPEWADRRRRSYRILFGELPAARTPGATGEVRTVQWIAVVSALVLLIACGNVGNLLLVRGLRRSMELALKASLGATRGRLVREILIEAGLLSLAAGALALLVVIIAGTLVGRLVLPPVLAAAEPLDARLMILAGVVCVLSAFLVGAVPALRLTSSRMLNPARSVQSGLSSRLLDAFVALQVALSLPLAVGGTLFSLSLWHARQANFGLETTNVVVVSVSPEDLDTPAEIHAIHRRLQERLQLLPQVQSAALVQSVPMGERLFAASFEVSGSAVRSYQTPFANGVDPSFFALTGLRFVSGRAFSSAENVAGGRPVLVINETTARTFWPGESPVGRCAHVGPPEKPCAEVIGIVANAAVWPSLGGITDAPPAYYVPIEQYGDLYDGRAVLLRTNNAPDEVLSLIRTEAQHAGPALPYIDVWALDDMFQPALRPLRMGSTVFVAFALLALIIAGVGLAAVTAYTVMRRTREIGIRLVLGADPRALVRRILGRSLAAVSLGLAGGCLLAYAGSRWLESALFGVDISGLGVYVATVTLLMIVGVLAAYVPARRAARVEPAAALRTE